MRTAIPVFLAAAALLAGPAATAGAVPQCTDIGVSTRMCVRPPGHTAIISSPNPAFTNPFPGWGFGTVGPAFGVGGIWVTF